MKLRILNAEPEGFSEEARAVLREIGELTEEALSQAQLAERICGFDVLIVRLGLRVTRSVLEASPQLRVVVTATTGLDHVDLAAAAERGVTVLSLRGETDFLRTVPATAEHTWALLLALLRRIPWAFQSVLDGAWDRDRFRGRNLAGRRLGVLGLGRIGERVAHYGQAFDMQVGAHDPHRGGWVDGVRRDPTLEALLMQTDILTVHLPLNDATRGLLTRDRLALLPKGALVVNTARGAILDERGVVSLLEEGHLAGAAVDVLAAEWPSAPPDSSLLVQYARSHDTLLITPHLGGATWDSMGRTEAFMAAKLRRFLEQEAPGARIVDGKTPGLAPHPGM